MPSRQDEQKYTIADLNREIVEFGHTIALNPKDANFYRERGLRYWRIREYDKAISDLDKALSLAPNDARTHYLRGLAWHRKNDPKRAIADYDKAIELDPANAKFYREYREKAKHDAQAVYAPANSVAQNTTSAPIKSLTGFFRQLAQYYAEFLSTDFKKQRLPRRRLENADAQGRLIGIPLRKYPGFQQKLWEELAKPIGAGLSLTVSRGSWRAMLPKAVVETTATYIAQVTQRDVDAVVGGVMKNTLRLAKQKGDDPDIAFEQFAVDQVHLHADLVVSDPWQRASGATVTPRWASPSTPNPARSRILFCTGLLNWCAALRLTATTTASEDGAVMQAPSLIYGSRSFRNVRPRPCAGRLLEPRQS